MESPVAAGCEVMPVNDPRFVRLRTPQVFREDRDGKTVFHHELAPVDCQNVSVWHVEMAGELHVPPGCAELMYKTEITGHSGGFTIRVE